MSRTDCYDLTSNINNWPYIDEDSSDDEVEEYIEARRAEYNEAWGSYMSEWEN